jgi:hypothetical protein
VKIEQEWIDALRKAQESASLIQGFHYKPHFAIRDLRKPHGPEQEVWWGPDSDRETYEAELYRSKDTAALSAVALLIRAQALEEAVKLIEPHFPEPDYAVDDCCDICEWSVRNNLAAHRNRRE